LTSEEIKSLLQYSERQSNHIMPNEIFKDLQSETSINNAGHIAFCYSYYYLTSWLYRQAKYMVRMRIHYRYYATRFRNKNYDSMKRIRLWCNKTTCYEIFRYL